MSSEHPIRQQITQRFDGLVDQDIMKLKARIPRNNNKAESVRRHVYIDLVAIPVLLIVALIFFLIATMDGKLFGTPDDELDSLINDKMKEIMNEIDKNDAKGASNNDQLIGDSFDKIKFALRIVPSMDNEDFIMQQMAEVGGEKSEYTGLITGVEYDDEALGDMSQFPQFFEWSNEHRHNFPVLRVDQDSVPSGNSAKYCLGVSWNTLKKSKQWDKYLDVRGFDMCAGLEGGRANWESYYPSRGLNFLLWDQHKTIGDKTCSGGIYVTDHNGCYKYQIMKEVCLLVKFEKDISHNTYSWVYTGGCLKDNKPILYDWADTDVHYNFHDVKFQVRLDNRPSSDYINDQDNTNFTPADDGDEDTNLDENGDPIPTAGQVKQAKIQKEKENLEEKRDNGEIQPQGMYLFYRIFCFISFLALLLSCVASVDLCLHIRELRAFGGVGRSGEEGQSIIPAGYKASDENHNPSNGGQFQ